MSPIKSLSQSVSALALGLSVLSAPVLADDSELHGVANIDVGLSGAAPQIVVRNVAQNHLLQNLQLAVQGTQVSVGLGAAVTCTGVQIENWKLREGHYLSSASYGIGETGLLLSKVLANSTSIDHVSAMGSNTFQMPIAMLNNPQIGVDPVAIVQAAADQAQSKLNYLRQDHVIDVELPVRIEAGCAWYSRNKVTKQNIVEAAQASYLTKTVTLKIKYEGDPQLTALNAQLGNNQPNKFQAGPQPLEITQMTFQPNMPHHVGACPATTKIRVFYQGQGKGELRIRINDGGKTIHNSSSIAFDSKNGQQHYDFEIHTPKPMIFDLNKTFDHNLRVYVRAKDESDAVWPTQFALMDSETWKHRCTPQVNPVLGGGGGGGYKQGGAQAPAPAAKPLRAPLNPAPTKPKRAD